MLETEFHILGLAFLSISVEFFSSPNKNPTKANNIIYEIIQQSVSLFHDLVFFFDHFERLKLKLINDPLSIKKKSDNNSNNNNNNNSKWAAKYKIKEQQEREKFEKRPNNSVPGLLCVNLTSCYLKTATRIVVVTLGSANLAFLQHTKSAVTKTSVTQVFWNEKDFLKY